MDKICMNSKNNKCSEEIHLKRSDTKVELSNFSIYYTWIL